MAEPEGARGAMRANLCLIGSIAIWGSFFPLLAHLLETWDPYSNAAGRAALGAAVLAIMASMRRSPRPLATPLPWRRIVLLGVVGVAGFNLFMTLGIAHSGPISASIVATTGPISAAVLGRTLYGRRIAPIVGVAAALAVAGGLCVALAHGEGWDDLRGGELLVFAASVSWMWYSMRFGEWLGHVPQTVATAMTYGVGAVMLIVAALVLGALGVSPLRIDTGVESLGLMLVVAVSSTAVAVMLWLSGVARLGVTVGAAYGNLVPVVAVATAWATGTVPRGLELIGGLVVIAGVALTQLGPRLERLRTRAPSEG
ncbi:MAG: DMT family transporter [Alphaproteobacteria bacterium]|nr:DMT family transporter [Alphaproteobacteria bacterium]